MWVNLKSRIFALVPGLLLLTASSVIALKA